MRNLKLLFPPNFQALPIMMIVALASLSSQHSWCQENLSVKAPKLEPMDHRSVAISDVKVPEGYKLDAYLTALDYPVDIAFGDQGEVFVAEAGGHTYGTKPEKAPNARILQIMSDGKKKVIYDKVVPMEAIRRASSSTEMPEGLIPPITGLTWYDGKLYISHRSRYSTLDPATGEFKTIVNGLPSWGEFLNAKPIFKDGKMYFFLSTQGNSGVIESHWLKVIDMFNKPQAHEVPGEDVVLAGVNFPVPVVGDDKSDTTKKMTGAYVPLGTTTKPGQVIKGQKICNGAFFRCNPDGTRIERIAWGLRSSFGYRFSPDGKLIATMNSANPMPPRGLWYDYEPVYEIKEGLWYGWPDFYSGIPITDSRWKVKKGEGDFVLTTETHKKLLQGKSLPEQPIALLSVHSAAEGMVFGREDFGVSKENILVAEMGTIVPKFKGKDDEDKKLEASTEKTIAGVEFDWPGFKVQQVDLKTGLATDFLVNKSGKPASATKGGGLERPLQLEWGPDGSLYIVDFGIIEFSKSGMNAHSGTGVIWKVTKNK